MLMIEAVDPRSSSSSAGCEDTSTGTSGSIASGRNPLTAMPPMMSQSVRSPRPVHGSGSRPVASSPGAGGPPRASGCGGADTHAP